MNTTWALTLRFLQVGFFSIGGGYATIPLIQEHIVDNAGWLDLAEYLDIITISQMTPGPLAVNVSTFVGLRLGGVAGAIAATFGCIASGVAISLLLCAFFRRAARNPIAAAVLEALKAASIGLIACAAFTILVQSLFAAGVASIDVIALAIFIVGIVALRSGRLSPTAMLAVSGLAGAVAYW